MLRRWGVVALVALGSVAGLGSAAAACSYVESCRPFPKVSVRVTDDGSGYVASSKFSPGGLVSVPGLVQPIPPIGPIGPIGDGAVSADTTVDVTAGSVRVGPTQLRTPAGDVSIPGLVQPIPQPGPIGPIGRDLVVVQVVDTAVSGVAVGQGPWSRAKAIAFGVEAQPAS